MTSYVPSDRIDEKEAADFLGVSTHTLRLHRYRKTGPPYFKLGRRVVYDRIELQKYMNKFHVVPR